MHHAVVARNPPTMAFQNASKKILLGSPLPNAFPDSRRLWISISKQHHL
jgi:hypothetical protein